MLLILQRASQLKYSQLMEVYLEENTENARRDHPDLSQYEALAQAEQDFYGYLKDVFFQNKSAFCAIWDTEGRYKAALRMEPYRDGFLLSGLSTAPGHRRKGYASALVLQTLDAMPQGAKIYSHVEKSNAPSIALHKKCGFTIAQEYAVMLDGSVLHNFWTFLYGK